jgi:hypothetical protein
MAEVEEGLVDVLFAKLISLLLFETRIRLVEVGDLAIGAGLS